MRILALLAILIVTAPKAQEIEKAIVTYNADNGSLTRAYSFPQSPQREQRMRRFLAATLASLEAKAFDRLTPPDKIDYIAFKNYLEHELRQLDLDSVAWSETKPLVPFFNSIIELEEAKRTMQPVEAAKAAITLEKLEKNVDDERKAVEADKTSKKTLANRAARTVDSLRDSLRDWFEFYNGYDPLFTWWTETPYKAADQALDAYAKTLREKIVGIKSGDETAIVGDPIGSDALLSELAYEMIPYKPKELIDIANKEFAWCEAEMKKASREMGFGDDWKKALEKVKTMHVEPGKQPDLVRDLALEAIAFLDEHDLVTIPELCRETWRREMMSPRQQLVSPFFLGGEVIHIAYPTNTMSHEAKMMSMRGNNIHFARATVHHELIPGHHLDGFMSERHRPYRSLFWTPFHGEGWALYWEMLLWDLGFAKSPENKVGMLFWRMHRCARIIFSLGFHLEQMTPQQCIDFLVDRVGHERANAEAEVRRSLSSAYGPLYQCAYMLCGLQFRALHTEMVGSGKMTNRQFHDAILHENSLPVELVRAILRKDRVTKDFRSSWRFYEGKQE
ncbi:MAG: DUF885 domain-containing protein [Armatimonadetes bacterium]|nr:DUF885 domain-containing protein [Armatimonadota bacterium]